MFYVKAYFPISGAFVVGVTATDADAGLNRIVTYSLSQSDSSFFNINSATGVVTVKNSISTTRTFNFQVTAADEVNDNYLL